MTLPVKTQSSPILLATALAVGVLLGPRVSGAPVASTVPDVVGDLIEKGRGALEERKLADAERIFQEAAEKDGNTLRTRTWLIRCWMEDGRINDSLDAIDKLEKEGAKGPAVDYLYGMAFALKARGYLESNTGGAAIQMSLDDAVMFLDRAVKADPELARDAFLPLAEAGWYGQKFDIARPAAEKAVARTPSSVDAHFMLGRIALSQYAMVKDEKERAAEANAHWDVARAAFARAAELLGRPEDPALAEKLARIRVDLGHSYVWKQKLEEAQREYGEAISWMPPIVDMPRVRNLLGPERFLAALESAASQIASRLGAEAPEIATVQWWLGWSRYEQKQYAKADEAFSAAVAKWPGYTNAWFYIGLSRYHQRDHEGAVAALRRHFDEDPADLVAAIGASQQSNLEILDVLVGWLAEKSRFEEAAIVAEIQTAVEPTNTRFLNNVGLFWRDAAEVISKTDRPGAAEQSKEWFEKSWKAYSKALEVEPENPALLNDAAVILHYYLDRDPDRAKAMYAKATERATIELEREDLTPDVRELYEIALRDSKNNLEKLNKGDKRND